MILAQVTVELRELLRNNFELFDFEYNFDDQNFKKEIEQHVINYFMFYEISQETPARFKHYFKTKWLSMIGYYNDLHNTTLLEYNPLINYKMSEAMEELRNTTNTQDIEDNTQSTFSEDDDHTGQSSQNTLSNTTDNMDQVTPSEDVRADDFVTETSGTQTDTATGTVDSDQTESTTSDTLTNEKTSDYPQQPSADGDYLEGERNTTTE